MFTQYNFQIFSCQQFHGFLLGKPNVLNKISSNEKYKNPDHQTRSNEQTNSSSDSSSDVETIVLA